SAPVTIAWEYWDGKVWRSFKAFAGADVTASQDGTDGLTHSGVVTLRAECGESQKTTVRSINAHWVRGRLDQPLPPDTARVVPMVDRIRLRSTIDRAAADWEVLQQESTGPVAIHGVIKDRDGSPLSGVEVQQAVVGENFSPPTPTDAQGRYRFEVSANKTYS